MPFSDLSLSYDLPGRIRRAARLIRQDPRFFITKARAKLRLLGKPVEGVRTKHIGSVVLECDLGEARQMQLIYRDAFQLEVVTAIRRSLHPGGVFLDVGAHIGYMSAVAMDRVGTTGEVHAFEPVPVYFDRLQRLAEANPSHHLYANRFACSDSDGEIVIHVADPSLGSWEANTALEELLEPSRRMGSVSAPMQRLDAYLEDRGVETVSLIKIDVEGFEPNVLRGLEGFFRRCRPPVICEFLPKTRNAADTLAFMDSFGYSPRSLPDGRRDVRHDISRGARVDALFVAEAS